MIKMNISRNSYTLGLSDEKPLFLDNIAEYRTVTFTNSSLSSLTECLEYVIDIYKPTNLYDDTYSEEVTISCENKNLSSVTGEKYYFDMVFTFSPSEETWANVRENGIIVSPLTVYDSVFSHKWATMDSEYLGIISSCLLNAKAKCKDRYPLTLWRKVKEIDISPPFHIEKVAFKDRSFNIVQEGIMPGGSKQRMYKGFENIDNDELVYAGPNTGMGLLAVSIIGKYYGKRVTIFTNPGTNSIYTEMTRRAAQQGAKIITDNMQRIGDLEARAREYCRETGAYCCPFGLDTPQLRQAWINEVKSLFPNIQPKRIWIAAGSGTLLKMLSSIFPNTMFSAVQVGKTVRGLPRNTTLYTSRLRFEDKTSILPPYKSVPEYDAKVWEYVLSHGESGDYIWNVGY